jgi:hypothetical protein
LEEIFLIFLNFLFEKIFIAIKDYFNSIGSANKLDEINLKTRIASGSWNFEIGIRV